MLGHAYYPPADPIDPATLSTGADGCIYNIQDLTSLRQDNLDTAAVVGQPVGMILDRWIANALGSNLVTNGDFPTNTTGWAGVSATLSVVSARLRVTNSGAAAGRATQTQTTVVGVTYKCTVDLTTNANGAAIAVGSASNAGTDRFLLTIPAGTTGSYTFYFTASTTTSFLQLRTTSTTNGHFTEWDNVTCKSIAGRHQIQQTSTARPILRQDALGYYYLEGDGVDDFLLGGLSYTIPLPHYIFCLIRRKDAGTITGPFGIVKNTTNFHRLAYVTGNRIQAQLRNGVAGLTTSTGLSQTAPVDRLVNCDSLAVAGAQDYNQNRRVPESASNTWAGGDTVTLCAPIIFGGNSLVAAAQLTHFYYGGSIAQDPGASRAGIRAYMANLAGAD
jgi:hypothetical protein